MIHIGNTEVRCKNYNRVLNITTHLDDHVMVEYYNASDLYLAPSTSEGFNFPVIESINCGVPVLGSDIEIFHEVLMDSPYLIPLNIDQWKDTIESFKDRKVMENATDWYSLKIGQYYKEKRGKKEFIEFYHSLGIEIE